MGLSPTVVCQNSHAGHLQRQMTLQCFLEIKAGGRSLLPGLSWPRMGNPVMATRTTLVSPQHLLGYPTAPPSHWEGFGVPRRTGLASGPLQPSLAQSCMYKVLGMSSKNQLYPVLALTCCVNLGKACPLPGPRSSCGEMELWWGNKLYDG